MISLLIIGIFIIINLLYFTNLIPPIPLSLKEGSIYHSIQKNLEGNYDIIKENYGWKEFFNLYKNINKIPGTAIYAYSAVFSPKDLNLTIFHEWQYYNKTQKKWITGSVVRLPVIGGRDGGFRTYSMHSNLSNGRWRVNVKTESGQIIGRIRFNILLSEIEPILMTGVKK